MHNQTAGASTIHRTPLAIGRPLSVLLTGNTDNWDLPQSYRRAFAELGHAVELFDWYGPLAQARAHAPQRIAQLLLVAATRRKRALDLIRLARTRQPDVLLLLKTDDIPRGTIGAIRAVAPNCRIAAFHPDDPFKVDRLRGPSHPRSTYTMKAVDHYFIWSHRLAERIRAFSGASATYLGFASDPAFMQPTQIGPEDARRFGADASFIGNWDRKREEWLLEIANMRGISLAIWGGTSWRDQARTPRVRACWRGLAVGEDFAKAVRCSRLSINILRPQNESAENMRTYEIPACGGGLLAEWSDQQARIFLPGKEAAYGRTAAELALELRNQLRAPPQALDAMRAAALERAQRHTYRHRVDTMLAALVTTG